MEARTRSDQRMPLSEHEERVFAEIERQLEADDPRLVARAQRRSRRSGSSFLTPRRRLILAGVGVVVGIICVLSLIVHVVFGIVGFFVLLASITLGVSAWRAQQVPDVEILHGEPSDDPGDPRRT